MINKINRAIYFIAGLCCFSIAGVSAQQFDDNDEKRELDLKILFRINKSEIDQNYMNNSATFQTLDSVFTNPLTVAKIGQVSMYASSSVDGPYSYNKQLSDSRISAVERYINSRYPDLPSSMFNYVSVSENWAELRECVVEDMIVPFRSDVLAIIDNSALSYDEKESRLKSLADGVSWDYLKEYILPYQRYGVGVLFVPKDKNNPVLNGHVEDDSDDDNSVEQQKKAPTYKIRVPSHKQRSSGYSFAVKTNLLSDLVSALNIALEFPISDNFSVSGEWVFPWWRGEKSDFTMQVLSGHLEAKYWLGDRSEYDLLTGWSVGVYGGMGTYDIQPFSTTGASGNYYDVGIQAGYAHSIAENLHLEYELGIGYVNSGYRIYDMVDTADRGRVKEARNAWDKEQLGTVMPSRIKVSLVWMINL